MHNLLFSLSYALDSPRAVIASSQNEFLDSKFGRRRRRSKPAVPVCRCRCVPSLAMKLLWFLIFGANLVRGIIATPQEDACNMPPSAGPCLAEIPRWYFDLRRQVSFCCFPQCYIFADLQDDF